ncbi:Rib/alpha/Esp surface antigen repeat-containing protein [Corynebacterium mycetoides]|uniref:Rib/alpha/Esp surface antigen repeat-containing protein n=1 Tax=Corynebacterium mycetoides TaxID=38302 RepID=A0A1G9NEN8_9CORY|nr:Rib/alpha-like domain-containing protein [Corynebacterium mycetoides]SDL85008.1 Rib/alpha/Esp surface antigen repeat-containing protein [Corynebacterium mycetoides]
MSRSTVPALAVAIALSGSALAVPALLPTTPFLPGAQAQTLPAGANPTELNKVASTLNIPAPADASDAMTITANPTGEPGRGVCSVNMWAQSYSQPAGANGSVSDVFRPFQVTPASANAEYADGTAEGGVLVSQPSTDGAAQDPRLPDGLSLISTMGGTALTLDGWSSAATGATTTMTSRMRLYTEYAMDNIDIAWRLDPKFTPKVTAPQTFGNVMAFFSFPGYTNNGQTLTLTWERGADGTYYARVRGSLPARTQAMASIAGTVPSSTWLADPTFDNTAALTSTYSTLNCGLPLDRGTYNPGYQAVSVAQGATAEAPTPLDANQAALPPGTRFSATADTPGWVTVNADGSLSVSPGFALQPGDYTVPVLVEYPDGSSEIIAASVTVTPSTATSTDVNGMTPSATQGVTTTTGPQTDAAGNTLPSETTYEPGPKKPSWVTVNPDGGLTVTPPANADPGDYTFDVAITYPDGSTDTVTHTVTVVTSQSNTFAPELETRSVDWGATATIPAPADPAQGALPDGTTFTEGADFPDWATLNPDGSITVSPDNTVPDQGYTLEVVANYPDGTSDTITTTVQVNNPDLPTYQIADARQSGTAATEAPLNADGTPLTNVTGFALGDGAPAGASIDPSSGVVTWAVPADQPVGSVTVPVVVTYTDGGTSATYAVFDVTESDANLNQVDDKTATVVQGQPYTLPPFARFDGSPLTDVKSFAFAAGTPDWVAVDSAGVVTLKPPFDAAVGTNTYTVTVTYADGTTDTAVLNLTVAPSQATRLGLEGGRVETVVQGQVDNARPLTDAAGDPLPTGTTFTLGDAPAWASISDTGELVLTPPADADTTDYPVVVTATFPDGSTAETTVIALVAPSLATSTSPAYGDPVPVRQDGTATVAAPTVDGAPLPEGSIVFEGPDFPAWATLNADGSITLAPGADVAEGTYEMPVVVRYPDGSTDTITAQVTVQLNDANATDPTYQDGSVRQGGTTTLPAPSPVPAGTTFAAGEGTPPWVTVNSDGSITAAPPLDAEVREYTFPVTVTYADGTADTIAATVSVTAADTSLHAPVYQTKNAPQGQTTTVPAPRDPNGDEEPAGTTYAAGSDTPTWVTVNPDGSLTLRPDTSVQPGPVTFGIEVAYADGSTDTAPVTVNVVNPNEPVYPAGDATQGQTYVSEPPTNASGAPLPAGTLFSLGAGAPATATIDPATGVVTWPVRSDQPVGAATIPVVVAYPDRTTAQLSVVVNVVASGASRFDPTYETTPVTQGATATVATPVDPVAGALPENTEFAAGEGAPSWATVNPDGTIAINAPADLPTGTYTVPVTVTYPDGSTETVNAPVTVTQNQAGQLNPVYSPTLVSQGETATVIPPRDGGRTFLPEGTTYAPASAFPDWATLGADGSITLTPGRDVAAGTTSLPVTVTYPDGSTDTATAVVTVGQADAPIYPITDVVQGFEVVTPAPAPAIPGAVYRLADGAPAGMTIDPSTGQITWTPDTDFPAGPLDVTVVAAIDGTETSILAPFVVAQSLASVYQPDYPPVTVAAGGTLYQPRPLDESGAELRPSTTFAPGEGVPEWVAVGPAGSLTFTPPADTAPGDYSMTVVVTYQDGSTEEIPVEYTVSATPTVRHEPVAVVADGASRTVAGPAEPGATYAPVGELPTWATVDPATGTVTIDPAGAAPGEYTIVVEETGPNGVVRTEIPVTVHPAVAYGLLAVEAGGTASATPAQPLPAGATVAAAADLPEWVTVNPDGTVTAQPGPTAPGETVTIPLVVTYADGTTAPTWVTIAVSAVQAPATYADQLTPFIPAVRGAESGPPVTGAPAVTAEGVDFPSGTTFAGVGLPDGVTVDPATGAVTMDPAVLAPGEHAVTIEVTYPDGSTDRVETTVTVDDAPVADPSDADTHTPFIPAVRGAESGPPVTGAPAVTAEGVDFPSGTTFAGVGLPDGVTVDPATGAVTMDPAVLAPGEHAVTIEVTYPDGSTDRVETTVTVDDAPVADPSDADTHTPFIPAVRGAESGPPVTGAPAVTAEGVDFPSGTTFAGVGLPDGVTVDPATGAVTVDPAVLAPGEHAVTIEVTYPDGSTDQVETTVTVDDAPVADPSDADTHTPFIPAVRGAESGPPVTGAPAVTAEGVDFPSGTTFAGVGLPDGVTVDPATGAVTVDPAVLAPGEHAVTIEVTYPDGSTDQVETTVTVDDAPVAAPSDADTHTPVVPPVRGVNGGDVVTGAPAVTAEGVDFPSGTTFAGVDLPDGVTVDPATGAVTVDPAVLAPGEHAVTIEVTYPDGSTDRLKRR